MMKKYLFIVFVFLIFLISCPPPSPDNEDSPTPAPSVDLVNELSLFYFKSELNGELLSTVNSEIDGNKIKLIVPFGTNISALIATFETTTIPEKVLVENTLQESGVTINDFSSELSYTFVFKDESIQYDVLVIIDEFQLPTIQSYLIFRSDLVFDGATEPNYITNLFRREMNDVMAMRLYGNSKNSAIRDNYEIPFFYKPYTIFVKASSQVNEYRRLFSFENAKNGFDKKFNDFLIDKTNLVTDIAIKKTSEYLRSPEGKQLISEITQTAIDTAVDNTGKLLVNSMLSSGVGFLIQFGLESLFTQPNESDPKVMAKLEEIDKKLDLLIEETRKIYNLLSVMQDQMLSIPIISSKNEINAINSIIYELLAAENISGAKKVAEYYLYSPLFDQTINNIIDYGKMRMDSARANGLITNNLVSIYTDQITLHYIFDNLDDAIVTARVNINFPDKSGIGQISYTDAQLILFVMKTRFFINSIALQDDPFLLASYNSIIAEKYKNILIDLKDGLVNNFQNMQDDELYNKQVWLYDDSQLTAITTFQELLKYVDYMDLGRIYDNIDNERKARYAYTVDYMAEVVTFIVVLNCIIQINSDIKNGY